MNTDLRRQRSTYLPRGISRPSRKPAPACGRGISAGASAADLTLEAAQMRIADLEAKYECALAQATQLARALTAIAEHKDQEASTLRAGWSAEYCCGYVEARVASGDIARDALIRSGVRKGYRQGKMR